ncbi:MAG: AAA family ATPase [Flavobacteriaceae bacterium]|nr:AAA family ATPase [Flavobacteriaceae bacterium]MCY4268533.1 AAA family ATPase [Flavobacteriaceae bacterium]
MKKSERFEAIENLIKRWFNDQENGVDRGELIKKIEAHLEHLEVSQGWVIDISYVIQKGVNQSNMEKIMEYISDSYLYLTTGLRPSNEYREFEDLRRQSYKNRRLKAIDAMDEQEKDKDQKLEFHSPLEIKNELDKYIIGQDQAKRVLCVAVYDHLQRRKLFQWGHEVKKSNVLMLGPPGTGKTEMVRSLCHIMNIPFAEGSMTNISETGYLGNDVESLIQPLTKFETEEAQWGIVYIDEIDKVCGRGSILWKLGTNIQSELLKMFEGSVMNIPIGERSKGSKSGDIDLDTTNMLFICTGAHEGLDKIIERRRGGGRLGFHTNPKNKCQKEYILSHVTTEDLKKYNYIPELLGRIPNITHTNPLDIEALVRILTEPKNSIIKQYKLMFSVDGVQLEFTQEALEEIAVQAINEKKGARGLQAICEKVLKAYRFEIHRYRNQRIEISKDIVQEKLGFQEDTVNYLSNSAVWI